MRKIVLVLVASCVMLSSMAQAREAGLSGVEIIKPGDPSFQGRVARLFFGARLSDVVQRLQRHAVVVVNGSGQAIVGYGVTWRYQEHGAKQNAKHWGADPIDPGESRFSPSPPRGQPLPFTPRHEAGESFRILRPSPAACGQHRGGPRGGAQQ